jgi:hypothetical protein
VLPELSQLPHGGLGFLLVAPAAPRIDVVLQPGEFGPDELLLPELGTGDWIDGEGGDARLLDPWGGEFGYRCLGDQNPDFDLWSAGPDGEADPDDPGAPVNRDNIENW